MEDDVTTGAESATVRPATDRQRKVEEKPRLQSQTRTSEMIWRLQCPDQLRVAMKLHETRNI